MSEKRFKVIDNSFSMWIVDTTLKEDRHEGNIYTAYEMCDKLNEQQATIQSLKEDNDKLRELIKKYVFGRYVEGSLSDLKFKAIAYDDIVKLELSNDSEPKVIVSCKQGKKETAKRFCQMFIPFGIAYEIVEMIE